MRVLDAASKQAVRQTISEHPILLRLAATACQSASPYRQTHDVAAVSYIGNCRDSVGSIRRRRNRIRADGYSRADQCHGDKGAGLLPLLPSTTKSIVEPGRLPFRALAEALKSHQDTT